MRALDKQLKASICESNLDKKEVDAVKPNWSSRDEPSPVSFAYRVCVTGVAVDSVNKTLISVGADQARPWNFTPTHPQEEPVHAAVCSYEDAMSATRIWRYCF
jgi:hypothetical protein